MCIGFPACLCQHDGEMRGLQVVHLKGCSQLQYDILFHTHQIHSPETMPFFQLDNHLYRTRILLVIKQDMSYRTTATF